MEHKPIGTHLLATLNNCEASILDNSCLLLKISFDACSHANMRILDYSLYHFNPHGVTLTVLLAESHCALHSWPEHNTLHFEMYTCGDTKPELLIEALNIVAEKVKSSDVQYQVITRK